MNQACLCRLQLAQCRLRRVAGRANGLLRALPLGDIGVDKHEAATWNRVAAYFDDATVGARALVAHLSAGIFEAAAQLRLEIGGNELTPCGQIPKELAR